QDAAAALASMQRFVTTLESSVCPAVDAIPSKLDEQVRERNVSPARGDHGAPPDGSHSVQAYELAARDFARHGVGGPRVPTVALGERWPTHHRLLAHPSGTGSTHRARRWRRDLKVGLDVVPASDGGSGSS